MLLTAPKEADGFILLLCVELNLDRHRVCSLDTSGLVPLWLAALSAAAGLATRTGEGRALSWNCIFGRAFYTNAGVETETIQPLGVRLESGQTLAVWWTPGDTSYSMKVYGGSESRA